jgi:hypothetical protein
MARARISFLAFFLLWAKVQGWTVPALHVRICHWLETCTDPVRVLMVFRGAAKSTIYAVYKAWQLYCDNSWISLIWAADGPLATKLTRDTINVLRRHPLCGGMLPTKPGAQMFWVSGATDARNASMTAVGVNQNVTSARARDIDYDDVEVPKNIKTSDARENLRMKIQESTFILVPGGRETYIGTPHTHDSIYPELVSGGASLLKIPLFESHVRYEQTDRALRYRIPFEVGDDGLYVMTGIHKFARLLEEGIDYRVEGGDVVFTAPPNAVLDLYAHCAWPERFTREDVIKRRKKTRTLNYWDSQYMLEAKPITETRLDPAKIIPYAVEPVIKYANKTATMWLGSVRIVGMSVRWDPSSAKLGSDVSAIALVLQDDHGRRYLHRVKALTGEIAEFAEDGKRILGGQVFQICDLVEKFNVPRVTVETNGIGGFAPAVLKAALKQRKLVCGVAEEHAVVNKNKRILEAYEGPLSAGMLWAHTEVLDGEFWDQMKDFNPGTQAQEDDLIDAGAGAITDTPERIKVNVRDEDGTPRHHAWRPNAGVHEVAFER